MNDYREETARARVDSFLQEAARLTLEQWQTVYGRYFTDPAIREAGRAINGVALQALLDERNALAHARQSPPDPFLDDCAARIKAIARSFPGELLDAERGAERSQIVNVLLSIGKAAMLHREVLLTEPSGTLAMSRYFSLFEGLLDPALLAS